LESDRSNGFKLSSLKALAISSDPGMLAMLEESELQLFSISLKQI
jgi:hypothetical protein